MEVLNDFHVILGGQGWQGRRGTEHTNFQPNTDYNLYGVISLYPLWPA